jgi:glycosyltransferase involved in cell wall biosynthesis
MDQRHKIIFIIDVSDPKHFLGGAELHVADSIEHLNRHQFEITLVADNQAYLEYVSNRSRIRTQYVPKRKKYIGDIRYVYDLWNIIRQQKPTIVHTHKFKSSVWGRLAAHYAHVPIIISTIHGAPSFWKYGYIRTWVNHILNRYTSGFADRQIVFSEIEKAVLIEDDKVDPEKIEIIPNGIFMAPSIHNDREKDNTIITIGRLNWEKNQKALIEAMPQVLQAVPDVILQIVGSGPDELNLKALASKLDIDRTIVFLGNVEREKIPELLSKAKIFVLPSLWEAFPYTIIEASFAGLPIVATRVGGIPEQVPDRKGGILVAEPSPEALAKGLIELLQNPEQRKQYGTYNQKRATEHFQGEHMIKKLEALYADLLTTKKI